MSFSEIACNVSLCLSLNGSSLFPPLSRCLFLFLPFTHSLWHCLSTRAGNRFFFLYALFPVSVPAAAATAFFISLRTSFSPAALPGTRACSLAASPPVCYQRAPHPVPVSLSLSLYPSLTCFTSATAFDC